MMMLGLGMAAALLNVLDSCGIAFFQLLDVDIVMSTRGLYKLQQGTEVIDRAHLVQRATAEVTARREMAARAVTRTRIDLVGE